MKIAEHARGRWPEIVSRLVGEEYTNQRKHTGCPATGECGKGTPRFRFADKFGNGNYFCHCSDGEKDGFDLLMCVNGYDFAGAARDVESIIGKCDKDASDMAQPEMTYAERIRGQVCKTRHSAYLDSRALEVAPGLDWIKEIPYRDSDGKHLGDFPAMLAPIFKGDRFLTYHVTYLNNGKKLDVTPCRKIMPGPQNNGGACPLYPAEETMIIAEGVETAIAAKMIFGYPAWAALNTALLASWEPPAIAKSVIICGDNDANFAGQAAAYTLANRLSRKGVKVEMQIAPEVGKDWNDVLQENRSLAA